MVDVKTVVARNIRSLRKSAGLSQQKLADKTGMSIRYINYLENNESNVTIEVLERIATGIGVPVAALVSEEHWDEGTPPTEAKAGLEYGLLLLKTAIDRLGKQEKRKTRTTKGK